jgi:hypothetical protein
MHDAPRVLSMSNRGHAVTFDRVCETSVQENTFPVHLLTNSSTSRSVTPALASGSVGCIRRVKRKLQQDLSIL